MDMSHFGTQIICMCLSIKGGWEKYVVFFFFQFYFGKVVSILWKTIKLWSLGAAINEIYPKHQCFPKDGDYPLKLNIFIESTTRVLKLQVSQVSLFLVFINIPARRSIVSHNLFIDMGAEISQDYHYPQC